MVTNDERSEQQQARKMIEFLRQRQRSASVQRRGASRGASRGVGTGTREQIN